MIPFFCSWDRNRRVISFVSSAYFLDTSSMSLYLLLTHSSRLHNASFLSSISRAYSSNNSSTDPELGKDGGGCNTVTGDGYGRTTVVLWRRDRICEPPSSVFFVCSRGGEDMGLERRRGAGGDVASFNPILLLAFGASAVDHQ